MSNHLEALRTWLERLAEDGALVPAARVLERLPDLPVVESELDDVGNPDLTAEEAGRALGRSGSTVRAYCRDGLLPGAYRQQGREWRVPRTALVAFRDAQTAPAPPRPPAPPQTAPRRRRGAADLSAWREERPKCA